MSEYKDLEERIGVAAIAHFRKHPELTTGQKNLWIATSVISYTVSKDIAKYLWEEILRDLTQFRQRVADLFDLTHHLLSFMEDEAFPDLCQKIRNKRDFTSTYVELHIGGCFRQRGFDVRFFKDPLIPNQQIPDLEVLKASEHYIVEVSNFNPTEIDPKKIVFKLKSKVKKLDSKYLMALSFRAGIFKTEADLEILIESTQNFLRNNTKIRGVLYSERSYGQIGDYDPDHIPLSASTVFIVPPPYAPDRFLNSAVNSGPEIKAVGDKLEIEIDLGWSGPLSFRRLSERIMSRHKQDMLFSESVTVNTNIQDNLRTEIIS